MKLKYKILALGAFLGVLVFTLLADVPTADEYNRLSGVRSPIQAQIDALGTATNGTLNGVTLTGTTTNSGTIQGIRVPLSVKAANYTNTAADQIIVMNASTKTNTLPTAASIPGRMFSLIGVAGTSNNVLKAFSTETIQGSTNTWALTNSTTVVSDGTNWVVLHSF